MRKTSLEPTTQSKRESHGVELSSFSARTWRRGPLAGKSKNRSLGRQEIHGRRIHPRKIPRIRFLTSRTTPQVNGWIEALSEFERQFDHTRSICKTAGGQLKQVSHPSFYRLLSTHPPGVRGRLIVSVAQDCRA